VIGISVMTADIFSDNVQTVSNRMGIDRARRPGPGVSLTTSSEDSFSFSDIPPNTTECTCILGRGAKGIMVAVWAAAGTAHVLSSRSETSRGSVGLTRCTANALLRNRCPDRGLALAWLSA
jgi:hypothetical protein